MSAKKQTFEQEIARLEEIVAALEKGDAPLADSLALFEEGTKLIAACSQELYDQLTPGTKIQVTGYKTEWSGEVEIIDASIQIVEGGDTFVAEPLDVTELLGADTLIDHQNQLVSFKGLTVKPSQDASGNEAAFLYSWDGSGTDGDDLYFNASYNGETYTLSLIHI